MLIKYKIFSEVPAKYFHQILPVFTETAENWYFFALFRPIFTFALNENFGCVSF